MHLHACTCNNIKKKTIFQGEGYIFAVTGYVTGYRKCNLLGGYKVTGYRTSKSLVWPWPLAVEV